MEECEINESPEDIDSRPPGNFIINSGAVIAALLGFPSLLIGIFGFFGVLSGEKLVAGALGALWGYLAAVGAYELNRRKFNWLRGRKHRDLHLMAGTVAASVGLIISGGLNETMPALVIIPALSALMQANDGHNHKYLALIHAAILIAGISIGIWFYTHGIVGEVLIERVGALP